jgi:hypothetical protein
MSLLNSLCGTLTTRPRNKRFLIDLVIERIFLFGLSASMRRRLEVNIFEFRLLVWREHTGCVRTAAVSDHPTASMAEMPVEECGDLAKSTKELGEIHR